MQAIDIAATEVKNKFGEVLRRTQLDAQHFIIRRDGIPVAALIPLQDYERLVEAEMPADIANSARRSEVAVALAAFLAEIHQGMPDVPEAEVEADVAAAIAEVRDKGKHTGPHA
jgi:prevent-host-death family protein